MARTINRNDLGYLGADFQRKLVKCFVEDQQFFVEMHDIVDQNMFTDDNLRRIVGLMKDRYQQVESVATYNDLIILVKSKITDGVSRDVILATLDAIRDMEFGGGIDLIEGESEKFFKQQNLTKAINQAQDIIKKGDINNYYQIEDLIQKALQTNTKQDFGFRLFETIESDLRDDYRQTVPTGFKELDESLFGGLGKGELGVIISPMGVGKTSATTGFCANAATYKCDINNNKGFKVLHFFFEDDEVNIRRKYYGYVTDIDACMLSEPNVRPRAIQLLNENTEVKQMLKENIVAKRLSTGEVTASEVKTMIQRYISMGFKPDLVVIDYFECLKPEKTTEYNSSEWSKEGITMRKLETICKEFNLALWVPVQSTKDAIGQEFVGLMHAGGSVRKTQIGHVIITLAQTIEQKNQGKLNMFLGKLRAAKIGRTQFPNIDFNNGTCKFSMDTSNDYGTTSFGDDSMTIAKQVRDYTRKN